LNIPILYWYGRNLFVLKINLTFINKYLNDCLIIGWMPNLINNNLKLNYSIMKTCSQNNHFAPIRANKLNKTDMSMILQGLAPEENYTNI